jgi:hypothetical protein
MVVKQGLDYATLGEDIGQLLGMKHPGHRDTAARAYSAESTREVARHAV